MHARLTTLVSWITWKEWVATILIGAPSAAWLIAFFPPVLSQITVLACVTTGACLAMLIGFLRQMPQERTARLAVRLALLLLVIGVAFDLIYLDDCVDSGGVWDWNRAVCRFE